MKLLEENTSNSTVNQILKDVAINEIKNRKTKYKKSKKSSKFFKFSLYTIISIFTIGLFLMYGPYSGFRNWYITTAMTTMNHQYLATWFYNDEAINAVLDKNKVIEIDEITDPTLIITTAATPNITYINEYENPIQYENEFEQAILERVYSHPEYKIIPIKGGSYTGYLTVIYDPSTIKTLVTNKIGEEGQYLTEMATENNATIAINGGVFTGLNTTSVDINEEEKAYGGSGGSPQGITISEGNVITNTPYGGVGGVIGFDENNKLVLGKMDLKKAQSLKIRDAVTCGPFLIINGESSKVLGNGGWGSAPRTAIGQRQDGIVLMLTIDGRRATMRGATMEDLIQEMEKYGAYNAAALDGGTSTALVENGYLVNDPLDSTGAHQTRPIATGFGAVFN